MARLFTSLSSLKRMASAPIVNQPHPLSLNAPQLPFLALASDASPAQSQRQLCRNQISSGPTAKAAPGFLQANLVVVERRFAFDFLMFAMRNPKSCPLLDVVTGNPPESRIAPNSDLRRDLPRYRVWQRGRIIDEPKDVTNLWPNDAVSFLLGCSFTFENDLRQRGLLDKTSMSVPMYKTKVENEASGPFKGKLVVSMRMFSEDAVPAVIAATERHALSHGAPVAIGYSGQAELGIERLDAPDFGEIPDISKSQGRVPVFWACGVTPQSAIEEAGETLGDSIVITHAPGCMFITDVLT